MQEDPAHQEDRGGSTLGAGAYGPHESAGYWVQRLARSMREHFEGRLAEHGLTFGLWPILGALHGGGVSTPSELAKLLGMDPSSVTRQLDRLEKRALLVRSSKGSDRRSISLELTEQGRELVPKLAAMSRETNERFLRGLTGEEAQALHDIILKMLRNAEGPLERLW